jgi:peptide-methionine (S)-S-oxide reductase
MGAPPMRIFNSSRTPSAARAVVGLAMLRKIVLYNLSWTLGDRVTFTAYGILGYALWAGLLVGPTLAIILSALATHKNADYTMLNNRRSTLLRDEMNTEQYEPGTEMVTLGGGCFWCTEAVFNSIIGVLKVEPGYSGGRPEDANYVRVSTGRTGHAEVVQVTFDPNVISLREVLEIYFATHDPTTLNQQGADVGPQYRSVVFYHDEVQKRIAEEIIEKLDSERKWENPIVTKVELYAAFYRAEDNHLEYYERNRNQPYCRLVIDPKILKLRERFTDKLKK